MIIPKNWEEIEAKEAGDYVNLSVGPHICKILDVHENFNEITGNTTLKVSVDIDENNEYKDYFKKMYDNDKSENKKWSNNATKYLSLKDEQLTYLKGFFKAVENSNNLTLKIEKGKELNLEQFNGLKIVGVFGLEEYQNEKGEIKTATRLTQFRSLDKLDEIKIPKVKLLNGGYVDYDDYMAINDNKNVKTETLTGDKIDKFINDNLLD